MSKLTIFPGACGMEVVVEVVPAGGNNYTVTLASECAMVKKLGENLGTLGMMDVFKRHLENPVYVKGAACLKHAACPVPSGILKALEVAAGLNVPRDVTMIFEKDPAD